MGLVGRRRGSAGDYDDPWPGPAAAETQTSENLEQISRTVRSRGGERPMQVVDDRTGARAFQVMVEMRDGTRLNTFVFLPGSGGPRWPVILHRTPYRITAADARYKTDCPRAWL